MLDPGSHHMRANHTAEVWMHPYSLCSECIDELRHNTILTRRDPEAVCGHGMHEARVCRAWNWTIAGRHHTMLSLAVQICTTNLTDITVTRKVATRLRAA